MGVINMSNITVIKNSGGQPVGELIDKGDRIVAMGYTPNEELAWYQKSDNTTRGPSGIIAEGNILSCFFFPVQHRSV